MIRYRGIFLFALCCAAVGFLNGGFHAAAAQKGATEAADATIINSRTLSVDHNSNVVTFSGDVRAENDEMVIECQDMKVYYEEAPDGGAADRPDASYRVEKIVSTGDVRITRALGGVATAETAVYHQAEEKMVLTGNPVVRQGKDYVQGDRIIFYIKENRSVAESAGSGKVKAVIFSGEGDK
jgi:lipopolysaccharide export system protein LptA